MKKFLVKLLLGSGAFVNHFIDLTTAHKKATQKQLELIQLRSLQTTHEQQLAAHIEDFQYAKACITEAFQLGE